MDCLEGEDMHVWKGKTWMSARARHGCLEGQDMDVWKGKTWMSGRARHGCLEGQDMDVWKGKTWMSGRGRHGCLEGEDMDVWKGKTWISPTANSSYNPPNPSPTLQLDQMFSSFLFTSSLFLISRVVLS